MFYLTENCGCHKVMVTDSHRQSQARMDILVYRIVQSTKSQAHQNDDLFPWAHLSWAHLPATTGFIHSQAPSAKAFANGKNFSHQLLPPVQKYCHNVLCNFFHNLQRNAWKTYQGKAGNFRVPKLEVFRQIYEKFCNCFCQGFQ